MKNSDNKENKTRLPNDRSATLEQLQQFWNHRINPITGFILTKGELGDQTHRNESKVQNKSREKFNKE